MTRLAFTFNAVKGFGGLLTSIWYIRKDFFNFVLKRKILVIVFFKSKEDGKDQELIQSSTKHDPRHRMGK